MIVLAHIKEQSRLSLASYDRPRMTEELMELGLNVGHRRVGRLMRENGMPVQRAKKYKATTDIDHALNIAPNLLNRNFTADEPNQKWAGDISYVWTREGWLHLAVVLDLHSRRVIALRELHANPVRVTAWAVSNRMRRDLAIRALNPLDVCHANVRQAADGRRPAATAQGLHPSCRPWRPVLLPRLSGVSVPARLEGIPSRRMRAFVCRATDERQG